MVEVSVIEEKSIWTEAGTTSDYPENRPVSWPDQYQCSAS